MSQNDHAFLQIPDKGKLGKQSAGRYDWLGRHVSHGLLSEIACELHQTFGLFAVALSLILQQIRVVGVILDIVTYLL